MKTCSDFFEEKGELPTLRKHQSAFSPQRFDIPQRIVHTVPNIGSYAPL